MTGESGLDSSCCLTDIFVFSQTLRPGKSDLLVGALLNNEVPVTKTMSSELMGVLVPIRAPGLEATTGRENPQNMIEQQHKKDPEPLCPKGSM